MIISLFLEISVLFFFRDFGQQQSALVVGMYQDDMYHMHWTQFPRIDNIKNDELCSLLSESGRGGSTAVDAAWLAANINDSADSM